LVTTPESLNLMLTGKQSRQIFGGLRTITNLLSLGLAGRLGKPRASGQT
jgi:hypothetical protein